MRVRVRVVDINILLLFLLLLLRIIIFFPPLVYSYLYIFISCGGLMVMMNSQQRQAYGRLCRGDYLLRLNHHPQYIYIIYILRFFRADVKQSVINMHACMCA